MADSARVPTYTECVASILQQSAVPLTVDEILYRVRDLRALSSGAHSAVLRALAHLYQAVPTSTERFGWLSHMICGSYIRHPLNEQEVRHGYLMLDELEHAAFFPEFFQNHAPVERTVQINLFDGPVLTAAAYVERRTWSLALGDEFPRWVERLGGSARDNIIIYADDAPQGVYTLRLQPYEMRDIDVMKARNLDLAVAAETVLVQDRRQRAVIPAWELAAALLGSDVFKQPEPPDELHAVLYHFSLLTLVEGEGYRLETRRSRRIEQRMPHRNDRGPDPIDSALHFLGWGQDEAERVAEPVDDWLDLFGELGPDDMDGFDADEEHCNAYARYLDRVSLADGMLQPLSHRDFHLVAAELEYILALEEEFDGLLSDQVERKRQLAERLLLDPEAISNEDLDIPDNSDFDDPPFWEN